MTGRPAGDEARHLAELGQGFSWPLDDHPAWQALIPPLRAGLLEDGAAPGTTPYLPEGAAALAGRLARHVEGGGRVLALDADPVCIEALALLGCSVVAGASHRPAASYAGVARRRSGLVEVAEVPLRDALPESWRGAFAAGLVDGEVHPTRLVPVATRALVSVEVGAPVSVSLHPLQRDHARTCGELLPAGLADRHDESSARLIACAGSRGPRLALSDFPWDQWILHRMDGAFALDPAAARQEDALEGFDPELRRHGTLEVHDVEVDPQAIGHQLDQALDEGLARAGIGAVGEHAHTHGEGRFVHRFRALDGGGHLALVCDKAERVINVELLGWTPRLQSALVSALIDHVPRAEAAVRFRREAA